MEKTKATCLPVHVEDSINMFIRIIEVIEGNIFSPKEIIHRELEICFDVKLPAIKYNFRLHCPYDISLDTYIIRRKWAEVIKKVRSLKYKNTTNVNIIIRQICQCNRSYFNKMMYKEYGLRIDDLINNPELEFCLMDKIDGEEIKSTMGFIIESILEFAKEGIMDSSICKTKVYIKNKDGLPSTR